MVDLQNIEIINRLKELIKDTGIDITPKKISETIMPVIDVSPKPKKYFLQQAYRASSGSGILHTCSSVKDTYLVYAELAGTADATADNTEYELKAQPHHEATDNLITFVKTTTTAFNQSGRVSFPEPILLERGSTITMNTTFSAGTSNMSGTVLLYEMDTNER